jgi:hypothetical protein
MVVARELMPRAEESSDTREPRISEQAELRGAEGQAGMT